VNSVSLFLCGDLMTGRGIDQVLAHSCPPHLYEPCATSALEYVILAERAHGRIPRPLSPAGLWGDGREVLARESPDVRIVNLETSVALCEDAWPKHINYRMHPGNIGVLTALGIDCAVLANNHVLDWGTAGLLETLDVLDRARVRVAGAGCDLAAASAPAAIGTRAGGRVLVFAFGLTDSGIPPTWAADDALPGVHLLPDPSLESVDRVAGLVRAAKRPGDIAVASIHWGGNWGYRIASQHRRLAHALIEHAAIDVVHGHSSHHPRAIEVYRGHPILYGCGDLLNDYEGIAGYEEYRPDLRLMYFPVIDAAAGVLVRLTMAPLRIGGFCLGRAEPSEVSWLRERLDRECRRFGHAVTQEDDRLVLQWQ
jgi:poly-gamma-glutamate capsule biosynthesis protein CapA/YwtB (metallophosphatase superfamily)